MKKLSFCLSALFFCLCIINAQTERRVIWDFPIKPGTEEWKQLKSMTEAFQAVQIPDSILQRLDTKSLVDLCLRFPIPPLFPLFNTPQQAFRSFYASFNGIRELLNREDAGKYLLKSYASMSLSDFNPNWELHEQGRFAARYKLIEAILSQPRVMATLDDEGRRRLLKESLRKMGEKIEKSDLFGGNNLEINLWVIAKTLYSENELPLQRHDQQRIQTALETGRFIDIDVNMLYQQAKNFAYENE